MRPLQRLFAISLLSLGTALPAGAQPGGVGYPTVAAALEALKARSGVRISIQDGWTIVDDPSERAVWSFTPPGYPAYPAAVKRSIVEKDGQASIQMTALCQATKGACDQLMAMFQAMTAKAAEDARRPAWKPSEEQAAAARATLARFLAALGEQRYADAYSMLTPANQALISADDFVAMERQFAARAGGGLTYREARITWYKDPPRAAAPGVYAAFNVPCSTPKVNICEEIVILHQQDDGKFLVMRQERNVVDAETERKLREREQNKGTPG